MIKHVLEQTYIKVHLKLCLPWFLSRDMVPSESQLPSAGVSAVRTGSLWLLLDRLDPSRLGAQEQAQPGSCCSFQGGTRLCLPGKQNLFPSDKQRNNKYWKEVI